MFALGFLPSLRFYSVLHLDWNFIVINFVVDLSLLLTAGIAVVWRSLKAASGPFLLGE